MPRGSVHFLAMRAASTLAHGGVMASDQVAHGGCFLRRCQSVKPHDAEVKKPTQENKLPEVLVLGDKHAVLPVCKVEQLLVGGACISVGGKDIVPETGQRRVQSA